MTHRLHLSESCSHSLCTPNLRYSTILFSCHPYYCVARGETLPNNLTMKPAESPSDPRVLKAVALWTISPKLTIMQVMLASEFDIGDAKSKSKQIWIRRRMPNGRKSNKETSPPPSSTCESNVTQTNELQSHPAPKPDKKRKSNSAAQEDRKNKKIAADHLKKAHKRATLLYNEEKKKGKEGK